MQSKIDPLLLAKRDLNCMVPVYINRKPGAPLDPKVREFLSYILSREGQEAVERDGKMLPLTAAFVREERRKLE